MRRLLLLTPALLAAFLVAAVAAADTKTVQITSAGFTPATTTINVGDTVTWHNADSANHQVVANDGSFASPVLKNGETYSNTFQKPGTFAYHDSQAPTHKGTIVVNGPPPAVTLAPSAGTIVYGSSASLSGAVSNQLTNEPVTLTAQPFGKGTQSVDSTTTSDNGTFGFSVSPTIRTTYQAHWRLANSPVVTVNVAPRVGFGRTGRLYVAKVTSDLTYGGHFVWVQRHGAFGWTSIKRVYLGSASRAIFRVGLPRGRSLLRLNLPSSQAGAGYVASLSRTLVVTR
jgi:plastocyanin